MARARASVFIATAACSGSTLARFHLDTETEVVCGTRRAGVAGRSASPTEVADRETRTTALLSSSTSKAASRSVSDSQTSGVVA